MSENNIKTVVVTFRLSPMADRILRLCAEALRETGSRGGPNKSAVVEAMTMGKKDMLRLAAQMREVAAKMGDMP